MPNPHICEICGKGKGGANHRECSKVLQAQHLDAKRRASRKKLEPAHQNFLTKIGTAP